jgi:hypothetical protein
MSICQRCDREMLDTVSCRADPFTADGRSYQPVRWGEENRLTCWRAATPCGDCFTPIGGAHHPGCDLEECPACGDQLISCGCFSDPGVITSATRLGLY